VTCQGATEPHTRVLVEAFIIKGGKMEEETNKNENEEISDEEELEMYADLLKDARKIKTGLSLEKDDTALLLMILEELMYQRKDED